MALLLALSAPKVISLTVGYAACALGTLRGASAVIIPRTAPNARPGTTYAQLTTRACCAQGEDARFVTRLFPVNASLATQCIS